MISQNTHVRKGQKHPFKPVAQHHAPVYETPEKKSSAWITRLTSTAIDPQLMSRFLNGTGETIRNQTHQKLQNQNGNRSIQREGPVTTASGSGIDLDELLAEENASQISRAIEDTHPLPVRTEVGKEGGPISNQLSNRIEKSVGDGAPLPRTRKAQMENKFGTEFSDVRLHTDTEADTFNQRLSARAFTLGSDIYFSHRATPQDDQLLSHELTHVVQQRTMTGRGPLTVGPADDHLEHQARDSANENNLPAYVMTFAEQREQVLQRDLLDELSPGNISGVTGTGADISTGLHQLRNLSLAKQLGIPAPQLTNMTQAPIIGQLSKIAAPIGLITGSMDMMNKEKPLHERVLGGMSALGGLTGTAGTVAGWLGSGLFSAGGSAGMTAGATSALTGGGAGLLTGAGASTALASLGAVAGAGAGGYALGRIGDELFGGLANLIAGDKKKDRTLSGYASRGMTWLDKKISGLWNDPSKPAYTQTIGWKLANLLGI